MKLLLVFLFVIILTAYGTVINSLTFGKENCLSLNNKCSIPDGTSVSFGDNLCNQDLGGPNSWTYNSSGIGNVSATNNWTYLTGDVQLNVRSNLLCFPPIGCCSSLPNIPCQLPVGNLHLRSDFATSFTVQNDNGMLTVSLLCVAEVCKGSWKLSVPGIYNCTISSLTCSVPPQPHPQPRVVQPMHDKTDVRKID